MRPRPHELRIAALVALLFGLAASAQSEAPRERGGAVVESGH